MFNSEDISLDLIWFERMADLSNINKEGYATSLGSRLTGKADDYTSLSPEIT